MCVYICICVCINICVCVFGVFCRRSLSFLPSLPPFPPPSLSHTHIFICMCTCLHIHMHAFFWLSFYVPLSYIHKVKHGLYGSCFKLNPDCLAYFPWGFLLLSDELPWGPHWQVAAEAKTQKLENGQEFAISCCWLELLPVTSSVVMREGFLIFHEIFPVLLFLGMSTASSH